MGKHLPTNILSSYLVLVQNGKTLLALRKNTGFYDGYYGLIAGHVEVGESFTQGLIREILEESNLTLDPDKVKVSHVMHRKGEDGSERVDAFYTTEHWQGDIVNREPEKCDDLSWFPLSQLPENTVPYIRQALEHIQSGITYSEWGW